MGLETGTFISDLVTTNPTSSDGISQGDDHLRLVKSVMKNTFPSATKAFPFPTALVKSGNYTVQSTDQNTTFLIDTSGGSLGLTLPTLASGDAGWRCWALKTTTDVNPFFVIPPSGTIQSGDQSGLAKTRRCVPGAKSEIFWTGTAWIVGRAVGSPLGAIIDCPRSGLPVGYEWANGQTLSSASTNYPDFFQANGSSGVVQDRRGRVAFGRDDMGGSAANRITVAGGNFNGTTLGATGGLENHTLTTAEIPAHAHANTLNDPGHFHTLPGATLNLSVAAGASAPGGAPAIDLQTQTLSKVTGITINNVNAGGGGAHTILPPAIISNMIVVVE